MVDVEHGEKRLLPLYLDSLQLKSLHRLQFPMAVLACLTLSLGTVSHACSAVLVHTASPPAA